MLVLHNHYYQGQITTDMLDTKNLARLAQVFNMPETFIKEHCMVEGRFNMLKAAADVILAQKGIGANAVSTTYAKDVSADLLCFRTIPVAGLDNPVEEMDENGDVGQAIKRCGSIEAAKREAKAAVQKSLGLNEDPDAPMLMFVGRMVKMKGVDLIADIAQWLLDAFPKAQLVLLGPPSDAHGIYTKHKIDHLATKSGYEGRLHSTFDFVPVSTQLHLASDFAFMPSRVEPFGYVDIEFARGGALVIGAAVGGLGKVPGFYYQPSERESDAHLRVLLQQAVEQAMQCPPEKVAILREAALRCSFPVSEWQGRIEDQYHRLCALKVQTDLDPQHQILSQKCPCCKQGIPEDNVFEPFERFEK
jgi:glycogen synthase